jgi:hypothetical protein
LTYLYQKVDFIAISRGFHHMKKGVIMRQMEVPLRRYFGVNIDGSVKSPSAALRFTFALAAYCQVCLTPQVLRALPLELFTKPSLWQLFTRSSTLVNGSCNLFSYLFLPVIFQ